MFVVLVNILSVLIALELEICLKSICKSTGKQQNGLVQVRQN